MPAQPADQINLILISGTPGQFDRAARRNPGALIYHIQTRRFARLYKFAKFGSVIRKLLLALGGSRGRFLSRDEIAEAVYGDREDGGVVDVSNNVFVARSRSMPKLDMLGVSLVWRRTHGIELTSLPLRPVS